MKFPKSPRLTPNQVTLRQFGGLNRRAVIPAHEACAMEHCDAAAYPALHAGLRMQAVKPVTRPHGIHAGAVLLEAYGTDLFADGVRVGTLSDTDKTFCTMGADVVIFPDKRIYRTQLGTLEPMEAAYISSGTVRFVLCDAQGAEYGAYSASATAPTDPADGQLWVDTSGQGDVLRAFSAAYGEWMPREACYIRIEAPGIGRGFRVQDGVELTGCTNTALGEELLLYGVSEDALLVAGVLRENFSQTLPITVRRRVPDLAFPLSFGNRLWGIDPVEHTIRASKLGDPCNFSCFMGLSTDSYAAQSGAPGEFTGSACVMGHPVFFTRDSLTLVYGSRPSNFSLQELRAPGVAPGCSAGCAIVGDTLYYPGPAGIYAFRGGMPACVSRELGPLSIRSAAAGALGEDYVVRLTDEAAVSCLYRFDTVRGLWYRLDGTCALAFAQRQGEQYMLTADSLFRLDQTQPCGWFWETGDLALHFPERTEFQRVSLDIRTLGTVKLELSRDEEDFVPQWIFQGTGKRQTVLCHLSCTPEHSLRLRLSGTGEATVFALQIRSRTLTEVEDA